MEIGIITYGEEFDFEKISKIFKKHFSNAKILVINNKKDYAKAPQIQGTNKDYEFSGYLELSNCFSSSGPYLIFNDTLFTSHFTKGWIWLICKFILVNNNCKNYIYGDLRFDGTKYEERPNPFLASWLFVIPNYETLKKFQFNLKYSLDNRLISTSKGYEEFLNQWISPKSKFSGWHGESYCELTKARKKRSIIIEHRLSRVLKMNGIEIKSIGVNNPIFYQLLRIVDRVKTRFIAFKRKSLF
jgi:hypothetical protein|tara:strand:+ start:1235 stop:1963 length:729 start_codon:yes stop_codon:yes gene_type:complete